MKVISILGVDLATQIKAERSERKLDSRFKNWVLGREGDGHGGTLIRAVQIGQVVWVRCWGPPKSVEKGLVGMRSFEVKADLRRWRVVKVCLQRLMGH